jgi:hypothetical protein
MILRSNHRAAIVPALGNPEHNKPRPTVAADLGLTAHAN